MRKFIFIMVALVSLILTSCSPTEMEGITYFYVIYNPDEPDVLWATHGDVPPRENGESIVDKVKEVGYQIPNDGSGEHEIYVRYSENSESFKVEFNTTFPIDNLSFEEYIYKVTSGEKIPWEVNDRKTQYVLAGSKDKLRERDKGYYVFVPIIY